MSTNTDRLKSYLDEVPDGESMPHVFTSGVLIPLHYIPMSIDIILVERDHFYPKYVDKAMAAFLRNTEIKHLLSKKFTGFSFDDEIPFIDYGASGAGFIYSDEIDADPEEVFFTEDLSQLTKLGATQLDLDLYCACKKLQFDEAERLLKLGANPEAKLYDGDYDDDDFTCMSNISTEASFEELGIVDIIVQDKPYIKVDYVEDFISFAAYEKMYCLLNKYCKD